MATEPLNTPTPENAASTTNLPARIPSANALILRTQTTLGLLRDVVQESSAEYWYELGKKANMKAERDEAVYAFEQCIKIVNEHWRATLQLGALLINQLQTEAGANLLCQAVKMPFHSWNAFMEELPTKDWKMIGLNIEKYEKIHGRNDITGSTNLLVQEVTSYTEFTFNITSYGETVTDYGYRADAKIFIGYTHKIRGIILDYFGVYIEAMQELDKFILLNPNDANSYNIRGGIKIRIEDISGAFTDFNHAIILNPTYYHAYHNRAYAKQSLNDYSGALKDYNYAILNDPSEDNCDYYTCGRDWLKGLMEGEARVAGGLLNS